MKKKEWEGGVGGLDAKQRAREKSKSAQFLRIGLMSGALKFHETMGRSLTRDQVLGALSSTCKKQNLDWELALNNAFGLGRAFTAARAGEGVESLRGLKDAEGKAPQSEREFEAMLAFTAGICAASGQLVSGRLAGQWLQRLIVEGDEPRLERALNCGLYIWAPLSFNLHPLELAARSDHKRVGELLLMRGAHPQGRRWNAPPAMALSNRKKPQNARPSNPYEFIDVGLQNALAQFWQGAQSTKKLGATRRSFIFTEALNVRIDSPDEPSQPPSAQTSWCEKKASDFARPLWSRGLPFETPEQAWSALMEHSEGLVRVWAEQGWLGAVANPARANRPKARL